MTETPEWLKYKANAYGHVSPVEYPYKAKPGEYLVGVFGSSVAHQFAMQGEKVIAAGVNALPGMQDRTVRVLSFAIGGQKQPHQLLALSYFQAIGQKFDLIINLDGINEAWGTWWNLEKAKIDWSLPLAHQLFGPQDVLSKCCDADIAEIIATEARKKYYEAKAQTTRSAVLHYGFGAYAKLLAADATKMRSADSIIRPQVDYIIVAKPDHSTFDDRITDTIDAWERSSIAMSAIAKQIGATYVHILPPNQYASNKKFSAEERRLAFYDNWVGDVYRNIVPKTYDSMTRRADRLSKNGVLFMDATKLFENNTELIYADGGGHYRQKGYELLAQRLGEYLADERTP